MKVPKDVIREEILLHGAISFERFMAVALYCPETGYYERQKDNVGRAGDFITSVSTGSLFGELLAFQFAEWLENTRALGHAQLIEAGAHDGRLAADILAWLQTHRAELFAQLQFGILEPSASRQSWQRETLKNFAPKITWYRDLPDLRQRVGKFSGVLYSNELLDAFPVRRLGWNSREKTWFEWGVKLEAEKFSWTRLPLVAIPPLLNLPDELLRLLPDGYTVEFCPSAAAWWHEASGMLTAGKLIAIDYGFTDAEVFSPARTRGTLRAYRRHHVSDDLLADPGEQDLTAHVNFSALQKAGESAGLKTEIFSPQPRFLTRILERALRQGAVAELDAKRIRQFQTLTHPEHLGHAFSVLIQST